MVTVMTMRLLGWAMLLVGLDPSLNGFDVLPDVAGWAIAYAVVEEQALAHPEASVDFTRAKQAALLAGILGGITMALFFSEQSWDVLLHAVGLGEGLAALAATWWMLMGVAAASTGRDQHLVHMARRLAVLMAGVLVGRAMAAGWSLSAAIAGHDATLGGTSGWVALRLLGALVELAAYGALAVFCFRLDGRPWLRPRLDPTA